MFDPCLLLTNVHFMRTQDVSMRDNSDDASNPQQGTVSGPASKMQTQTTYMKPISRVPPTKKDPNKLFVGGLPSNGTCDG